MNSVATWGVLVSFPLLVAIGGEVRSQDRREVCEGFEDGDLLGALPAEWTLSGGSAEMGAGNLHMWNSGGLDVLLTGAQAIDGDVSIRTQVRLVGFPGGIGCIAHGSRGADGGPYGYIGEIRDRGDSMAMAIVRLNGFQAVSFEWAALPSFDPNSDYIIQLDVRGERVELRVWKEGDEFPVDPHISIDNTYPGGVVGLNYGDNSGGGNGEVRRGIFRYIWYRESMIGPDDLPPCERGPLRFRRGDCNDDGTVDISDAIFTLGSLFLGQGDPNCDDACDVNDDGAVDISDAIMALGVLFLGQGPIPAPGMTDCGVDPTGDDLACERSTGCP